MNRIIDGIQTETERETVIKNDNDIKLDHKTESTGCQNKGVNR